MVESSLAERASAPRQADEGAPPAWLVYDPVFALDVKPVLPADIAAR